MIFLPLLNETALEAGAAIMGYFQNGAGVSRKVDGSPVTAADEAAEAIILKALRSAYPDIPILAEEEAAAGLAPSALGERFFLVDPLDGTREFISGREDFTVNIALIEAGAPTLGVVYAPAKNLIYFGGGSEAYRANVRGFKMGEPLPIRVSEAREKPVVVASRSHLDAGTRALCERLGEHGFISAGSSLKFCLVAEGEADLYPRLGPTMEWDTGAGDAVLRAAGGSVVTLDGAPLTYGKRITGLRPYENPEFLASGGYDISRIIHNKNVV